MIAQTEKIQALETQLATVQYDQQANGASNVAPSIPGRVPALISTSNTTVTKETMETMFKIWTAAQVATPAVRAPRVSGKEKKMSNLELTTLQMTWQMENVKNADTQIQQAIVHYMDMISNLIITMEIIPIDVMLTMNWQQLITC